MLTLGKRYIPVLRLLSPILFVILWPFFAGGQESDEDTYSISLVQTAEVDKEIVEIEDRKVLTETYTVKKGDRIWKIFREKDLLKENNLSLMLNTLRKLNKSLENLDLIHPGQKIVIPLRISPIAGTPLVRDKEKPIPVPLEKLDDIDLRNYTIKPGDSISKVVYGLYNIPYEELYDEYLTRLRELNPSIEDLNFVYPGQVIRLPIYSPKIVKMPIEKAPPAKPDFSSFGGKDRLSELGKDLGELFQLLGEDWVNAGKHFIPLKSGGQINLNADSYPIVNLSNGNKVIVDIFNELPEKMAGLITKDWANYIIVHLEPEDDLRRALKKILPKCGYEGLHGKGETFKLVGDISLQISADWIIRQAAAAQNADETIIILTIRDSDLRIPQKIEHYLNGLGVKVVEYPLVNKAVLKTIDRKNILTHEGEPYTITEMVLNMVGQNYTRDMEIPVYQSERDDFSLIISTDFFFNRYGVDKIIDLTGLGSDIVDMLLEHQFQILQLSGINEPLSVVQKILEFLEIGFEPGPREFNAIDRDISKNVKITIPGILFQDKDATDVFTTQMLLPDEIADFLTTRDLKVLQLTSEQ